MKRNDRLLRILTDYVMPITGLILLLFCLAVYLVHHGRLFPHYNQ